MSTSMTSKGQVTVPKPVRDQLGLKAGDRVEFIVDEEGFARMVPVSRSIRELKGMVPPPERTMSLEDMEAAIGRGAGEA